MRTAACILGFGLTVVLAGCGIEQPRQCPAQGPSSPPSPSYASAATGPLRPFCALAELHGADVVVADMNDGVAITFAAPTAEVAQLRQTVRAMADASDATGDAFVACACGRGNDMGVTEAMPPSGPTTDPTTTGASAGLLAVPRARTAATETPTGAVLELRVSDPTQLVALRTAVKEHIHALRRGCLGGGRNYESPARDATRGRRRG